MSTKTVIGREEWCAFPELGVPAIKARIDSGAKTSSIHAFNIKAFSRDNNTFVNFEVHPLQKNRKTIIMCEAKIIDKRNVKSSTGISEVRYVINSPIKLGSSIWNIELTLTNRDSMGYRMLLGREAMIDRIMIDPSLRFTQGKFSIGQLKSQYSK